MRSTVPKKASDETTEFKQDVDAGKRGNKDGGRDRRLETVAAGGASHPPVDIRVVGAVRAG